MKSNKDSRIIVSFTSIPSRIETVHLVVENILSQTLVPDRIMLYLSVEDFPEKTVPESLSSMTGEVFNIEFVEGNLKSHKKYFYAMQEYPKDLIVTIDDDLYYPEDMIEKLVEGHKEHAKEVICLRAHTVAVEDGKILPYSNWMKEVHIVKTPSYATLATTGAGTLFPPKSVHKDAFDVEKIHKLAETTDDLWLKWMELKNKTRVVLIQENVDLKYIDGTQEDGLYNTVNRDGNDDNWHKIMEADAECRDEIIKIIERDYVKHTGPLYYQLGKEYQLKKAEISRYENRISKLELKVEKQKEQLNKIKKSKSYKIGRALTAIPKKFK